MTLEKYRAKRKFNKTPEPPPLVKALGDKQGDDTMFVVQKHHARALHYDFRLEMNGVLKSWAVPKGISKKPGEKRLAVMTEDHPLAYGSFEGIIPEGNYGAGTVEIWDTGIYSMLEQKEKSLKFILKGKKLKGEYVLFNFKDKNWFLFKTQEHKNIKQ